MQMAQKAMTSTQRAKSARPFANRSKQWTSNIARPDLRGPQNAQRRSYERYRALAQAQAQSGDVVGAENYYQHAEHYSDRCCQTEKRRRVFNPSPRGPGRSKPNPSREHRPRRSGYADPMLWERAEIKPAARSRSSSGAVSSIITAPTKLRPYVTGLPLYAES
jgi:hypothetical protein